MKFIYPAVFRKTEEGKYKGFFPDLECCDYDRNVFLRKIYDMAVY